MRQDFPHHFREGSVRHSAPPVRADYFLFVKYKETRSSFLKDQIMRIVPILVTTGVIAFSTGAATKIKIACIGNSITYGYGLSNQSSQSYPGRLQALFGTAGYTVQNGGVNSTTMTKKGDVPYWKSGAFPQVFSFQPDIITIKLGTNDTKPQNWDNCGRGVQYKADYLSMIDTLRNIPTHPRIFLILPVPVFPNATGASWGIRDSVIQKEISIIKAVAAACTLIVIDANTPLKNFPQYFKTDGVHPDAAGEDTIASVVYRALKAATATVPRNARYQDIPGRKQEIETHVGFACQNLLSPEVRFFDLTGRRIFLCGVPDRSEKPLYKWYILK